MTWHKTGTCTVSSGSTTVTGAGTAWVANIRPGEALLAPNGALYEIAAVPSDTTLTLARAYAGTSAAGQAYAIVPTHDFVRELAGQVSELIASYAAVLTGAGAGKFAQGNAAAPGVTFALDEDTGWSAAAANTLTGSAGGVAALSIKPDSIVAAKPVQVTATGALSGLFTSGVGDTFTVDGDKVMAHYGVAWKAFSDVPVGPSLALSSYGGMRFYTQGTERMRVSATGILTVGSSVSLNGTHSFVTAAPAARTAIRNTHPSDPYGLIIHYDAAPNDNSHEFIYCEDGADLRMVVRGNGGIGNFQGNNTNLSDERLKKDIAPLTSYWAKWRALDFCTFRYRDQTDGQPTIGLIAQQVEAVAPEFVDAGGFGQTPADGVPLKAIYTADLFHAMGKVLQEAQERIGRLEAALAAG